MKKIFKFLLISSFFSYYIIAIILNYPQIDAKLKPLNLLNLNYFKELNGIYITTYPNFQDLKRYKKKYKIKKVITLLNPNLPLSRELVKNEKLNCKKLGIEFIAIPITLDATNLTNFNILKEIIGSNSGVLINNYTYDTRLKIVEKLLQRG
jgi:hypothetical protein